MGTGHKRENERRRAAQKRKLNPPKSKALTFAAHLAIEGAKLLARSKRFEYGRPTVRRHRHRLAVAIATGARSRKVGRLGKKLARYT